MKKYFKYLLVICIFSCDKIESPLPEEYGKFDWSLYPGDPVDYNYDLVNLENNWGPNNNPKSILLEDYTGHKCTNCPSAAQIAKDLEDDSSKNVIVRAIISITYHDRVAGLAHIYYRALTVCFKVVGLAPH